MKISAWLVRNTHSHSIQDDEKMRADFKTATGKVAVWPSHTTAQTVKAIQVRGLGGSLANPENVRLCYGWEVATGLADRYAPKAPRTDYNGRGRIWSEAIRALREAGL